MMNSKDWLGTVVRYWWLMLACMLAGAAVAGITASGRQIYQANVPVTVSLDTSRTGLMTDVETDQLMVAIGDFLTSHEVMAAAIALRPASEPSTVQGLKAQAMAERYAMRWVLRVEDSQEANAAGLARAWGQATQSNFEKANQAALNVEARQQQLLALTSCLSQIVSNLPAPAGCVSDREEVSTKIERWTHEIQTGRAQTMGLPAGVWLEVAPETVEVKPVQARAGIRYLAGALIGLILALAGAYLLTARQSDDGSDRS